MQSQAFRPSWLSLCYHVVPHAAIILKSCLDASADTFIPVYLLSPTLWLSNDIMSWWIRFIFHPGPRLWLYRGYDTTVLNCRRTNLTRISVFDHFAATKSHRLLQKVCNMNCTLGSCKNTLQRSNAFSCPENSNNFP